MRIYIYPYPNNFQIQNMFYIPYLIISFYIEEIKKRIAEVL